VGVFAEVPVNWTVSGTAPDVGVAEKSTVIPTTPVIREVIPIIIIAIKKKFDLINLHKNLLLGINVNFLLHIPI
jgi:hypothetical protein